MDCGLLGHETIATFRIVAKLDNATTDNDEYSVHYDQNWDVTMSDDDPTGTNGTTSNDISMTTHGGYKIGQKKVVQFPHVYMETRSYDITMTATIISPNLPYLHLVQHTANYTIAMSEVVCFTTTGMAQSQNDTTTNNIFSLRNTNDDDFVAPSPTASRTIDVQNASSTETGENPSSSSSSSTIVPFRVVTLWMIFSFCAVGWAWLPY